MTGPEPRPGDEVGEWINQVLEATKLRRGHCLRMREPHAYWGFNTLSGPGWVVCLVCGDLPTTTVHITNGRS